jgi:hypothetical protein
MGQSNCIASHHREPWNKGKLVGQKAPSRLKEIWAIRIRLQLAERARELALFNLAVDIDGEQRTTIHPPRQSLISV